jgi:hypothetical protein
MDLPAVRGDASRVSHGRTLQPRWLCFLAVACLPLACLSASPPPAGQHLLAGRDLTGVYLSPSERDGVSSFLLVTLPPAGAASGRISLPVSDLYLFPRVAPSSAAGAPELVLHDFLTDPPDSLGPTIATDSLGRLWVVQAPGAADLPIPFNLLRLDLGAGTQELLAQGFESGGKPYFANEAVLSPARTQVCVDTISAVFPLHGEPRTILTACRDAVFLGEDIYYVHRDAAEPTADPCGSQAGLCRLAADGRSELVLASKYIQNLRALAGGGAHKLLLSFFPVDGGSTFALLDGETLAITPLPAETQRGRLATLSPDGRWLGFTLGSADESALLLDWTTGGYARVDAGRLGKTLHAGLWRPGRDELWLADPDADRVAVVKLAADPSENTVAADIRFHQGALPEAFTSDGNHWYRAEGGWGSAVNVGSADNPEAPLWPISPDGAYAVLPTLLADGRLLVESRVIDDARLPKDIAVVDPDTGGRRPVCSGCKRVALGHTRALLLVDWALADDTGNLTLVDLATLARTRLAESVYAVAVDPGTSAAVPPESDALASGTQVAFLVRNRLASPYDGLWLARLP